MDNLLVTEKLESIRRCIKRIEETLPTSVLELQSDADKQDILVLNLSRTVQLCVDIGSHLISASEQQAPSTMGETFSALESMEVVDSGLALTLKKAVGFRNIAVHSYQDIDWAIVYSICTKNLTDFKHFAKAITEYCGL